MKSFLRLSKCALWCALITVMSFVSCTKDDDDDPSNEAQFPETLVVDIPDALSASNSLKSDASVTSVQAGDGFDGHEIYRNLRFFVALAEHGANFVQEMMDAIRIHDLARELDVQFTSEDDGREKHLVVKPDQVFEGVTYQFGLTLSDLELESDSVGGIGLQIFWNSNPVSGVAIVKPNYVDRTSNDMGSGIVRIDYTQADPAYDATMVVSIAGLPLEKRRIDKFVVDNIKMFVGKKGDIVDIYGNSNHPYAYFESAEPSKTGLQYAFTGSANDAEDYAVAEVALPPSSFNSTSRSEIMTTYSIKNVLVAAVAAEYNKTTQQVEDYIEQQGLLTNVVPPGYFANGSFVASGTAPEDKYNALETRMNALTPYNPTVVAGLSLGFAQ